MRTHRSRPTAAIVVPVCVALMLGSCSRDADDLAEPAATPTTAAADSTDSSDDPSAIREPESSAAATTAPTAGSAAASDTSSVSTSAVETFATSPPPSVSELSEIGVPGLDSTDAFCAAWSRFAGSFQVVAVTAAFGSGPPGRLASLEVAASPVVIDAYDSLLANWPDELSSERDLVADDFLGPFARRLRVAHESLEAVGADEAAVTTIRESWIAGLARRDPSTPEFAVDLPDPTWSLIDAAAVEFGERLVPFQDDPSLVTDVRTPLTDQYLAVSCPDQGTLSGQEVDSP